MTRLAFVCTGHSPQEDLVAAILSRLPDSLEYVEIGALDGFSRAQLESRFSPSKDESGFSTSLSDGQEILVGRDFIHNRVAEAIKKVET